MAAHYLDFEQPIAELEAKIAELRRVGTDSGVDIDREIAHLEERCRERTRDIFAELSDWQVAQLARHPMRPHGLDYIDMVFDHFEELHGDRRHGDDQAMVGGLAKLGPRSVVVVAQEKGRAPKTRSVAISACRAQRVIARH